jgi:hypothetical protein
LTNGLSFGKSIEKQLLAGENSLPGARQLEPFGTIDFRTALAPSAFLRPLHFKIVTRDRVRIEISLDRKGMHDLAAALPDYAQGHERLSKLFRPANRPDPL